MTSKPVMAKYPYGPGTVVLRIDHIDAIIVKPKHFSPGFPPPEGEPWHMEIRLNDSWFSIEYEHREEAEGAADQLTKMISRAANATPLVEVAQ